jgi:hypothetical protein
MGVRSSWLKVARNSSLRRLPRSASSRASLANFTRRSRSAAAARSTVTSPLKPTIRSGRPCPTRVGADVVGKIDVDILREFVHRRHEQPGPLRPAFHLGQGPDRFGDRGGAYALDRWRAQAVRCGRPGTGAQRSCRSPFADRASRRVMSSTAALILGQTLPVSRRNVIDTRSNHIGTTFLLRNSESRGSDAGRVHRRGASGNARLRAPRVPLHTQGDPDRIPCRHLGICQCQTCARNFDEYAFQALDSFNHTRPALHHQNPPVRESMGHCFAKGMPLACRWI